MIAFHQSFTTWEIIYGTFFNTISILLLFSSIQVMTTVIFPPDCYGGSIRKPVEFLSEIVKWKISKSVLLPAWQASDCSFPHKI